ncbi:HAD family hydrolase [Sagittula salina]|uniref:HAD-IA family hydrolase n=1 Tax=Sagittula salina TaxID=2820268 RepID=A0A940MUH2_9RHOB|nr:HAD-IA family hydrolase [Sagittula salina]
MPPALIVWDFDGVLNAPGPNWAEGMRDALGVDGRALAAHLKGSGRLRDVMRGRCDLRALVGDWLNRQGAEVTAEAVLGWWFRAEDRPDAQVLGWLRTHPARHVIGTNNEPHRAASIDKGFGIGAGIGARAGAKVEAVFASGRMGVAKPDPGFFAEIERWAGLPPEAILLVDDAPGNVAAAKARGWRGFLFNAATRASLPRVLFP